MIQVFKSLFPQLFNQLAFRWQQCKYAGANRNFRQTHAGIALPDAYTLYESYQLHYKKYIEDGKLSAGEIVDSLKDFLPSAPSVLDWGCGPARITRHLLLYWPQATITGSDTNTHTIAWNLANIDGVKFVAQKHEPPLPFYTQQFDCVIGFSVFTHIPSVSQQVWLHELYRILKPGGIVWISTHGHYFIQQLSAKRQKQIKEAGIYNTNFRISGHRMMTTYHHPEYFKRLLEDRFELIAYFDGATHPEKAGKQDLWIAKKRV